MMSSTVGSSAGECGAAPVGRNRKAICVTVRLAVACGLETNPRLCLTPSRAVAMTLPVLLGDGARPLSSLLIEVHIRSLYTAGGLTFEDGGDPFQSRSAGFVDVDWEVELSVSHGIPFLGGDDTPKVASAPYGPLWDVPPTGVQ